MPEYSFTIAEHDRDRPWIVLSQHHRTVTLEDGMLFFDWARKQWPESGFTVQLDPWQLEP